MLLKISTFNINEELIWDKSIEQFFYDSDLVFLQEFNLKLNDFPEWYRVKIPKCSYTFSNVILSRIPLFVEEDKIYIQTNQDKIYLFNIHLTDTPYQPYQLKNIDYGDGAPFISSHDDAIYYSCSARCEAIQSILSKISPSDKVIIAGDFNEPYGLATSILLENEGFSHISCGFPTYTYLTEDEIDLIYCRGLEIKKIYSISTPSDHALVTAEIEI